MNDPLAKLATDPLRFVATCWPDMQLYDKQREVLLSVCDNIETFVHAANELGKTRIAAITAIWFFASRTPARVVTSSSSESQLKAILWSEIANLISKSALKMPFRSTTLSVEKLTSPESNETEPLDYVIGHVTNAVENFQGHHLPNDKPRVLVIFDEASGIADEFFDAADSWAHRKLVIGNPLSTTNFFYFKCKAGDTPDPAGGAGLLRSVIHIDGLDSPNVQVGMRWRESNRSGKSPLLIPGLLSYDDYLRRESQWDDVQRTTRLHGRFYEGDQAMLYPADWLDYAMDADRWEMLQRKTRKVEAVGVDIAGGGRDRTCWTLVDRYGIINQAVEDTPNIMSIPGGIIALIKEHGLSDSQVAIDVGGLGKGVADRLSELGHRVNAINFGETAGKENQEYTSAKGESDPRKSYKNRRAEIYGRLRDRLRPLVEDEQAANDDRPEPFILHPSAKELRAELAVLPLLYDSEGKLFLPPKDSLHSKSTGQVSIRSLLGHSPDRADSLVLALHALRVGRPQVRASWGGVINVGPRAWSSLGMPGWGGRW